MNEIYLIKKCTALVEEKLNWGNSENWIKKDFENLSEDIYNKSKIIVSVDTLKRLFGQRKTEKVYNPHIATKNALSIYLGYAGWTHFRQDIINQEKEAFIENVSGEFESKGFGKTNYQLNGQFFNKYIIGAIVGATLISASLFLLFYPNRTGSNERTNVPKNIKFNAKNTRGLAPHSVTFNYDVSEVKDSVFINFENIVSERIYLRDKKSSITKSFIIPGHYKVALSSNKEILASLNVHVLSKEWEALGYSGTYFTFPIKQGTGILHVSPEEFKNYHIPSYDLFWVIYQNIKDFNANGDDCTIETRLKSNKDTGGIPCYDSEIEIAGENSLANVTFVQPGCQEFVKIIFGDIMLRGDHHDLSFCAKDLSEWKNIKIVIKNKTASIYFENAFIYKISYTTSLGKIKGLKYRFKGFGAVDFIKLYDKNGVLTYEETF